MSSSTAGEQRTVWEQPPSTERVHLGQGDISSLFPVSPEVLEWNARWAAAFGWSRPPYEFLPWEDNAPEAGSASEPPGAPVVDVATQSPFLLGTALDLHIDAETLKISVPIQTAGPAPALTPLPVEEKEKIIAMEKEKIIAAEFLLREGESRECLGSWINSSAVHEAKKRRAKQVIEC